MGVEVGVVGVGVEVEDDGSISDVDVISGPELGVGDREELDVVEVGVASGIAEVVDGVKVLVVSGVGVLFTEDDDMVDDVSRLEEVCTKDDDNSTLDEKVVEKVRLEELGVQDNVDEEPTDETIEL
ncbi:hypothetical protein CUC08_Gglean004462 [Alternaria sp. MG1]|nr:hypothetical protein CUC08_Gglean004462 [Alternaria sp. MG1]